MGKNILPAEKRTSTPRSGQKRSSKVVSPGEKTASQSPTASPETKTAKRMSESNGNLQSQQSLPPDLEALFQKINSKLTTELAPIKESLNKIEETNGKIKTEIVQVKNELERMKRQILSKTLIIQGIKEKPHETFKDIHEELENLAGLLGISKLDYDNARGMGRPMAGRTRSIELTLLRQRDKMEILGAKKKLKDSEATKNVYINSALTSMELRHHKKLVAFARKEKELDSNTNFRVGRNQILYIQSGAAKGQYYVDAEGIIRDYQNKRGQG